MTEHQDMAAADEILAAEDPTVGAGTPATAPPERPPLSLLEAHPATVIGTATAIANAILAAAAPLPTLATAGLIVIVTLIGAGGIKRKVTPVAAPRLGPGMPLVPAP
jgi:hypothetical protein